MGTKVKELRQAHELPTTDPHCNICHPRADRLTMDGIWARAMARAVTEGSARVEIHPVSAR